VVQRPANRSWGWVRTPFSPNFFSREVCFLGHCRLIEVRSLTFRISSPDTSVTLTENLPTPHDEVPACSLKGQSRPFREHSHCFVPACSLKGQSRPFREHSHCFVPACSLKGQNRPFREHSHVFLTADLERTETESQRPVGWTAVRKH
jgi:hypothetical protein